MTSRRGPHARRIVPQPSLRQQTKPVRSLRDCEPDRHNANRHTPRGTALMETSIREYGYGDSITVDKRGRIISGNQRAETLADLGMMDAIVVQSDGTKPIIHQRTDLDLKTDRRAKGLAIAQNRVGEVNLAWDRDMLLALQGEGVDLSKFWHDEELAALLGIEPTVGRTDADAVPAERETEIQRGDLFESGQHRLLCGDSTASENVSQLMGGDLAALVYTDPPYGVNYGGGTKRRAKLAGDTGTHLYEPACQMAAMFSDAKAALYLWHGDGGTAAAAVAAATASAGYKIRSVLIWNKNQAQFGSLSAQYKQKHEPAYYCFKRGHSPRWFGPTNEVTVWDCDRVRVNEYHPTQKPVALAVRALQNSSEVGDRVLDLFLGSGATLIACEQTRRACRAIEIAPSYVQVAIDRWEAFTGQKALKISGAVRA